LLWSKNFVPRFIKFNWPFWNFVHILEMVMVKFSKTKSHLLCNP
jgi:hypothetical protein